ncbi:MAG TPA: hypothetical protein PLG15_04260 [Candidatus Gastranaerophilaceae bacterium]|nr:hypothetical protein [Candidatus Gastranaerophilaceae bacterium]HPT41580.1 hypothetical protein [Candidatus Gastranaerophilaceae bacterium]
MASIIDSFRETFTDNMSFFKLLTFAVPLYFAHDLYLKNPQNPTGALWLAGITIFFLFGFLIKVTGEVLNEGDTVLPFLNPLKLALASLKGIIAIGPITWLSASIATYVIPKVNVIGWFNITFQIVIWLIVIGIALTSFLMFVKNEKIADSYNLKVLFNKSVDLSIAIIFFIFQLTLINIPTNVFIGYIILVLFGFGPLFYFFAAYAIVFNVAVTGHYMAQLQYEVLGYDKNKMDF